MQKLLRILNGILTATITVFLSSMVFLVFMNVVLRYVFESGITWSEEMARYLFVWIVFLGAIAAFKDRSHLGVDILIGSLPPKAQKALYVFNQVVIIGLMSIVINGGVKMIQVNSNSYGPATGIPLSVLFIAATLAAVVIILMSLIQTFQYVVKNQNLPSWAKAREEEKPL
ncbi:TRAP transporter small permease [Alkalihalobacillus oceani]|uniref:TRAP transporter small permease n=1 Tax=Halalkalibacter oceani TaxID=1653776 RepID=UPI00203F40F3|nr:TRAP transporter small permease [Halalkalibacter oceani]MCM3759988.1 TRAP transporter small permease [Halalkalibacter oceani]